MNLLLMSVKSMKYFLSNHFIKQTTGLLTILSFIILFSSQLSAAPSPEQINTFKSLPKAQQNKLLKQQGINPSSIKNTSSNQTPVKTIDTIQKIIPSKIKANEIEANEIKDETVSSQPKLSRFGASLFAGKPSTFSPVNDIPIPTDYILGPGDQLNIQLYGNKNENYQLVVDRNGKISFPELGPVSVAGQNISDAKANLINKISDLGIGVNANITLGELRSFRIFVLGESRTPGSYLVSGMATITHALYVSGGISNIGSFRKIQLKRRGKLIATLDLYDLLLSGDTSNDVRLQPGDSVFIPVATKTVAIAGNVNRPAIYELKNERSFKGLLRLSGGATPTAFLKKTNVTRITKSGFKTTKQVNLTTSKGLYSRVKNGDYVNVPGLVNEFKNTITLIGEINRPGKLPWYKNLTLTQVLTSENDFKVNADLDFIVILRHLKNGGDYEVISSSWNKIRSGIKNDLTLKSRDRVYVFSRLSTASRNKTLNKVSSFIKNQATLDKAPKITQIKGLIKHPGTYPLANNSNLLSIIEASGGLQPNADIDYILIKSTDNKTGKISFTQTNLAEAKNIILNPLDQVIIFSNENSKRTEMIAADMQKLKAQATPEEPAPVINIRGVIKEPGLYPIAKNSFISDVIKAAGGLKYHALLSDTDVIRYQIVNGQKREVETITLNLEKALLGDKSHNIQLMPFDEVIVKQVANWTDASRQVTIQGEVLYPGTYTIKPGETLNDILARVGGFSEWAEPRNAVFLRDSLRKQEQRELNFLADNMEKNLLLAMKKDAGLYEGGDQVTGILTMGQTLVDRIRNTPALGRLVISLNDNESSRYDATINMELKNGDKLIIPKKSSEVLVTGEVSRTASVIFEPGQTLQDYLNIGGGLTSRADADAIYVVHGDGSIEKYNNGGWFDSDNDITILAGDTIVVPADVNSISPFITWTSVSKILANFAITAATLKTVGVFN